MTVTATAGQTVTLQLAFYNQSSGILTDPTAVQIDITFGSVVGVVPDVAGPYTYQGSAVPSSTQVYRTGTGQYALDWQIPLATPGGVYIANWTCTYGSTGGTSPGVEDIVVTAAGITPPANGDTGFWTGSLTYGTLSIPLGAVDANGITWALTKRIVGLDSAPASGQVVQRGSDHGGYATPQYYGPRPITLFVRATAPTQAQRDRARALMQQIIPINDLATFVYNEPIPKTMQVRRSGTVGESYPTLMDVDFSIGLVAPDPRKYSTVVQTASATTAVQMLGLAPPWTPPITLPAQTPPGNVVITNGGTFETRPMLVIVGPVAGPVVYNATTQQSISWSGITLGAADSLVIDLDQREGFLNGVYTVADLSSSWFVCEPGQTVLQLLGTPGAGSTLTATWSDAYM